RADVGVVKRGRRPRLVQEALGQRAVAGEVRLLQGDEAFELLVVGQVDGAHAAVPQRPKEAVSAEGRAAARVGRLSLWSSRWYCPPGERWREHGPCGGGRRILRQPAQEVRTGLAQGSRPPAGGEGGGQLLQRLLAAGARLDVGLDGLGLGAGEVIGQ